jgi:hypothetical protein
MSIIESAAADAAETVAGGAAGSSALPWLLLGAVVLVAGAALTGYVYGHRAEEAKFNLYKTQQAAAAEKQAAANKSALLAQQQADAAQMEQINQTHGVQLNEVTQRRDALLSANRDLSKRLYVSIADASKQPVGVPQAGTSASLDAATSEFQLPQQLAPWVVGKFTVADNNANLATALQQVVIKDRLECNGSVPGLTAAQ